MHIRVINRKNNYDKKVNKRRSVSYAKSDTPSAKPWGYPLHIYIFNCYNSIQLEPLCSACLFGALRFD